MKGSTSLTAHTGSKEAGGITSIAPLARVLALKPAGHTKLGARPPHAAHPVSMVAICSISAACSVLVFARKLSSNSDMALACLLSLLAASLCALLACTGDTTKPSI